MSDEAQYCEKCHTEVVKVIDCGGPARCPSCMSGLKEPQISRSNQMINEVDIETLIERWKNKALEHVCLQVKYDRQYARSYISENPITDDKMVAIIECSDLKLECEKARIEAQAAKYLLRIKELKRPSGVFDPVEEKPFTLTEE